MAFYDVRYVEYHYDDYPVREVSLTRGWHMVLASSAAEAVHRFKGLNKDATPLYTRPLTNQWDTRNKTYWFNAWHTAMAAMPYKIWQNYTIAWVMQPKGETPLPVFIQQNAKGKMRIIDGYVHLLTKTAHSTSEVGRSSALAVILGYVTWVSAEHKRRGPNKSAMYQKLRYSQRPRDPKMRKLLVQLGTMDRDKIKAMLAKKRKQMNQ